MRAPKGLVVGIILCALSAPPIAHAQEGQIGEVQLLEARRMLELARGQLPAAQWQDLNTKLRAAEQAWVDFKNLAGANKVPASIPADAAASTEASAAAEALEGAEAVEIAEVSTVAAGTTATVSIGALLGVLVVLWPSSIAPEPPLPTPDLRQARAELIHSLRDLAATAKQVRTQIQAAQKPRRKTPTKGRRHAPKPISLPKDANCDPVDQGGSGSEKDPVWCQFLCEGFPDVIEIQLEPGQFRCPGGGERVKWPQIGGFRRLKP